MRHEDTTKHCKEAHTGQDLFSAHIHHEAALLRLCSDSSQQQQQRRRVETIRFGRVSCIASRKQNKCVPDRAGHTSWRENPTKQEGLRRKVFGGAHAFCFHTGRPMGVVPRTSTLEPSIIVLVVVVIIITRCRQGCWVRVSGHELKRQVLIIIPKIVSGQSHCIAYLASSLNFRLYRP